MGIVFVVQNRTHCENFAVLAEQIASRGYDRDELRAVKLDAVMKQETGAPEAFGEIRTIEWDGDVPFYRMSWLGKLKTVAQLTGQLRNAVSGEEMVVVGSDGALQRCMINAVKKAGGSAAMVLDGVLFPWPRGIARGSAVLRRTIQNVAQALWADQYAPGNVAHGALDLAVVMDQTVKEILRRQGVETPIMVGALPRHKRLLRRYRDVRERGGSGVDGILYVTSAFRWHEREREHRNQCADLRDINRLSRDAPNVRWRIRIHPREELDEYRDREWPANVELSTSDVPLAEDLARATCVVTARSTVALEARMLGLPVYIYTKNFPAPDAASPLGADDYFQQVPDLESVTGGRRRIEERQNLERVANVIERSVTDIANSILRLGQNAT